MNVLIVEDTERLADALRRGLGQEGFAAHVEADADGALRQLAESPCDAVILDLGLPDMDGVDVLRAMRARSCLAPVLVLTARDAVASRVEALDAGADDYMIKPFAFDELLARLRALVRRASSPRWAPLACADVELVPDSTDARVAGQVVHLSPRERAVIEVLLRRQNQVVTRAEILSTAFGYDFDPGTNVLDVHISHLRHKLRHSRVRIQTTRGVGFSLGVAVE